MSSIMLLRKTIAFYLEDLSTPVGQAVDIIITGLILISSAIFVAEISHFPMPFGYSLIFWIPQYC